MRIIKFRLIKDDKVVGYEIRKRDGEMFHTKTGEWELGISTVFDNDKYIYFIPHDAKEQFTGKFDKNGTEIYGGDEVKGTVYQFATWGLLWRKIKRIGPRRKFQGTVFFDDIWFGWSVGKNNMPMKGLFEIDNLEVVGRAKNETAENGVEVEQ